MSEIRVSAPDLDEADIAAVGAVLRSGMLAAGPMVAELEAALCDTTGAAHAVAVSSGTSALHCAMNALAVAPGTEIVSTPFTFVGTVNPALMCGARLRFVDIDLDGFGPDLDQLHEAITDRTAAVVVVDLYGQPVAADGVAAAVGGRVPVVEDACQALGAAHRDRPAGNLFDVGCFSFYATKNVMSGEGGALVTDDAEIAASARRFRQHGMTGPYEYAELGYNYRMTDVLAALAVRQMARLETITRARQSKAATLNAGLAGLPGLVLPAAPDGVSHAWHQYVVRVTDDFACDRDTLAKHLAANDIRSAVYYPKSLPAYPHVAAATDGPTAFPNSERAAREVLALPVHPKLSAEDLERVVTVIRDIAGG